MHRMFEAPFLTRNRVRLAYGTAVVADATQLLLGPLGWPFADDIVDVIAMVLLWRIVGFHPLLLPTFALELVPVADMLPTWTACVALVLALRRRQQTAPPPPGTTVIDV